MEYSENILKHFSQKYIMGQSHAFTMLKTST